MVQIMHRKIIAPGRDRHIRENVGQWRERGLFRDDRIALTIARRQRDMGFGQEGVPGEFGAIALRSAIFMGL